MKNKAYIISYNNWWDKRLRLYDEWFSERGFCVNYITADFNHFTKEYYNKNQFPNTTKFVHVPWYNKNLSVRRIYSHIYFSLKILAICLKEKPMVIVGVLPCNSLGIVLWFCKKILKKTKLVIDITDMWPESLPYVTIKRWLYPVMLLWKSLRSIGIDVADQIICECDLFSETIGVNGKKNVNTIYLSSDEYSTKNEVNVDIGEQLNIAYLGSINHIIDIDGIVKLLTILKRYKKIDLHIVGGGASCPELIERTKKIGISVHWHGMIFNRIKTMEILSKCHFGLNMMKKSVFVGLTTKSIDYASVGLPMFNNIPKDSKLLIELYGAGFNIVSDIDIQSIGMKIECLSNNEYFNMREGAKKMFRENFSNYAIKNKVNEVLGKLDFYYE